MELGKDTWGIGEGRGRFGGGTGSRSGVSLGLLMFLGGSDFGKLTLELGVSLLLALF